MAAEDNSAAIGEIIKNVQYPLVLKNVCKWSVLNWSLDDWEKSLGPAELPFRCNPPTTSGEKPNWERECPVKKMTMKQFIESTKVEQSDWFYFDYKYMNQWFQSNSEIFDDINWESFGLPMKDASNSTIWIGSKGAHTPCHQDTYGFNIVVQVFGRKHWMLFPPNVGGMKPTRVPYEESSIYSNLNFKCPQDLKSFDGLFGCRSVILEPGEALIVPSKWWHFVENVSPVSISINSWIINEKADLESRVEEALTQFFVAQICKDLPAAQLPMILNPNEDELPDTPLAVVLLQVDTTMSKYLEYNSKQNGAKRLKLDNSKESHNKNDINFDVESAIKNLNNIIFKINELSRDELMNILKDKLNENKLDNKTDIDNNDNKSEDSNDEKTCVSNHLTSAIINSFCHPSIIKMVKENLINHYK